MIIAGTRRFLQMCSHHLVEPVACTPASGWEKGQVERQVIDELGYLPFSQHGGQFAVPSISKLYDNTLLLITTNLAFVAAPAASRCLRHP